MCCLRQNATIAVTSMAACLIAENSSCAADLVFDFWEAQLRCNLDGFLQLPAHSSVYSSWVFFLLETNWLISFDVLSQCVTQLKHSWWNSACSESGTVRRRSVMLHSLLVRVSLMRKLHRTLSTLRAWRNPFPLTTTWKDSEWGEEKHGRCLRELNLPQVWFGVQSSTQTSHRVMWHSKQSLLACHCVTMASMTEVLLSERSIDMRVQKMMDCSVSVIDSMQHYPSKWVYCNFCFWSFIRVCL